MLVSAVKSTLSVARLAARLAAEVFLAPTAFLIRLIFRSGCPSISQVTYNLAASRAAEALREDALFVDPLAKHFVRDIEKVARRRRQSVEERRSPAYVDLMRRTVSYTITRTKFFDDAVLVVLGDQEHGSNAMFDDIHEAVFGHEASCQQVVSLGSGFDSRPWRLPVESTRWFEVDLKNVFVEKRKHLNAAGASFSHEANAESVYPLRCLALEMVAANVCRVSWMQSLTRAGLKATVPTVWLMEGVLVYHETQHVERLLRQLSEASPLGSFLMASMLYASQLQEGTAPHGGARDPRKWGCPADAYDYFTTFGWKIITLMPWAQAAQMYGCKPRKRVVTREQPLFLVAVKA